MQVKRGLPTGEISDIFSEESEAAGGAVSDCFDDGLRLFARSIRPQMREVHRKDKVQGGVGLKATSEEIRVSPYVFRQVCKNGAIRAHALEAVRILHPNTLTSEDAAAKVREAVRACYTENAFAQGVQEMRSAAEMQADYALNMLPLLSRLAQRNGNLTLTHIMDRFFAEQDFTRFGLMNAFTAVAREIIDPARRWRLEEYGGGVPVVMAPPASTRPGTASLSLEETLLEQLATNETNEIYADLYVEMEGRELVIP